MLRKPTKKDFSLLKKGLERDRFKMSKSKTFKGFVSSRKKAKEATQIRLDKFGKKFGLKVKKYKY